ncbi:MAG: Excinuclease subunit-like [Candidatus Peribacteria bacterium]|nr:Excinuclease subunit-like [Candidatus Peribacteria bacterium]
MYYVYILESVLNAHHWYVGMTTDLQRRLAEHNAGESIHTNKFKPWRIKSYLAFTDKEKAENFERYLKTQSGRAFAKKYL